MQAVPQVQKWTKKVRDRRSEVIGKIQRCPTNENTDVFYHKIFLGNEVNKFTIYVNYSKTHLSILEFFFLTCIM